MCTAVREPSGSDRPPPASPVSACGVASGMRHVTASGGSAARGRPLPASATAQRLQACTRRRWLTGSRGYAVHGLGTDSRQAPGANHDNTLRSRCTASATHDRACPPTRKGATAFASRFCGRTNSRGYASRDCIGAGRPPDGTFAPAGRLSRRGDPEADGAETHGSRRAEVCNCLATMSARRATPRAKPGLRENSVDAMAGIPGLAPAGAAAVLPRYYLGYLNSLEHPWKTMERLVGTGARRGIPVWHWSAGKPRPQK